MKKNFSASLFVIIMMCVWTQALAGDPPPGYEQYRHILDSVPEISVLSGEEFAEKFGHIPPEQLGAIIDYHYLPFAESKNYFYDLPNGEGSLFSDQVGVDLSRGRKLIFHFSKGEKKKLADALGNIICNSPGGINQLFLEFLEQRYRLASATLIVWQGEVFSLLLDFESYRRGKATDTASRDFYASVKEALENGGACPVVWRKAEGRGDVISMTGESGGREVTAFYKNGRLARVGAPIPPAVVSRD